MTAGFSPWSSVFCLTKMIVHWEVTINPNLFQVFSAFGFVHKIATFEKAAGFQVRKHCIWFVLKLLDSMMTRNTCCGFISFRCCYRFMTCFFTGINPVHWCWDCIFSTKCSGWKKYTQVLNLYYNLLRLKKGLFWKRNSRGKFCSFIYLSSTVYLNLEFFSLMTLLEVLEIAGTCFRSMLVLPTCVSHILHILIWTLSFSLTGAGNKRHFSFLKFKYLTVIILLILWSPSLYVCFWNGGLANRCMCFLVI